ncbi:MAG TPA: sigma-70 family RNA polymerase sigma factor [Candidatus Methylomirabilis sp.]|nr:sigma-70 family RNA polymerase sigma factor [Candidatus Methylomirabilis sp.]
MGTQAQDDPVELIRQVARADREAFGRLYDRFAPLVFAFAVRVLGRRPEAEDLLQEVWLQVWRQAGSYRQDRGSPEAWISTITRSRAIDRLRSIRRREQTIVSIQDPPESAAAGVAHSPSQESDARLTVRGVLTELPEAQRVVLELAYFEGLTQTEIATRLGEPLGTVKTRMRTGLERLRGLLAGPAGGGAA